MRYGMNKKIRDLGPCAIEWDEGIEIIEKLAVMIHEQWSGWMKYLFDKGIFKKDGTWEMPKWAVERWKRQMKTEYNDLSEEEKESDRIEAKKFIEILKNE
jgi:hypothetical protein